MKTDLLLSAQDSHWLKLRSALWPDASAEEHLEEMAGLVAEPEKFVQFIARDAENQTLGFIEASIRNEYVNGTDTSPVAFLEGIYVKPRARRNGVARALVHAVQSWAKSKGCAEFASDAPIRNRTSHAVHTRLGFTETERVVYFRMSLK